MKKIGLIDVDYKHFRTVYGIEKEIFPNLALMKISRYYKRKGYKVEWYSPLFHNTYHKIFASKVYRYFNTEISDYVKKDIIKGGSGYDLTTVLPDKIEHIYPDYKLYKNIDYAMGFITRGCIRNCGFCIVHEKEGITHKNTDLEEFWHGQDKILLIDNNILSYEKHIEELEKLMEINKKIDFNQGLDIRLINDNNANLLSKIKRWSGKRLTFAFDNIKIKSIIDKKIEILYNNGIRNSDIRFFVLIGFDSTNEEDLERVYFLKERGIRPYIMLFNNKKTNQYQKDLIQWVNYKPFFFKMDFKTFLKRKKDKNFKL